MTAHVRAVAVTQDDPFFTGRFFQAFLEAARPAGVEVVEIVLLRNFNESRIALLRRLARFYPPPDLLRLVVRYAQALIGERRGIPRRVEAIALRYGIPVRKLETVNDAAFHRRLGERGVDVLLSVAAPEIFAPATLKAAPHVINVHNGRLPDYRGMMPTFWALLNGDDHVVVTVHEMAERLDAGPVLAEYAVPVRADHSAFEVAVAAKAVAGGAVARLLSTVATDEWPTGRRIEAGTGRYCSFPGRRDVERLRSMGRRLL